MLAENLFKDITYSFETSLEPLGRQSNQFQGIGHSVISIENFFMANRLDWYCFYDKTDNYVLFIDTGNPLISGSAFLDNALNSYGVGWEDTDIFLTHFHIDHAGNLSYCLKQGARNAFYIAPEVYDDSLVSSFFIWTHASDVIRGDKDAIEHLELLFGKCYFEDVDSAKCHVLTGKEVFDIAGFHLEVMPTPGHAPEHACLIDVQRKLLVAGDHLIFARPGMMQLEPDQHLMHHYVENIKTLAANDFDLVLMSHHAPLTDSNKTKEFIRHTWKSYENFLPQMKDLVASLGNVNVYGLASHLAGRHPQGINCFAPAFQVRRLSLAFGTLEGLYDYGLVERRQDDDGSLVYFVNRRR